MTDSASTPGKQTGEANKTRVAFLARSLEVGGAEVQLSLLARNLDKARFEVARWTRKYHGSRSEA